MGFCGNLWFQVGFQLQVGFSGFQVGFSRFQVGFSWFQVGFIIFQCSRLVFHGSRSVFIVICGSGLLWVSRFQVGFS